MRDQIVGDLGRIAEHEIQNPGRQPGVVEGAHQLHRAGRRFFRSLEDDGTARRQRAADLSRRRTHRKIPRRERRDRTDRLPQHGMPHAVFARDDAPIEPQSFGGVPFDDIAAAQDLEPGLIDRLALLERHRDRHLVDALADEAGGLQDDLRALGRRCLAPDRKSPFSGRERVVEIGCRRGRHGAEHAFIGWIDARAGRSRASSGRRYRVRCRDSWS